jgi:TetR/AcrR family transcriptional repressor of mexJK operon
MPTTSATAADLREKPAAPRRRWHPTDPRIARVARARRHVLEIAGDLFLREGFDAISMDQIATRAGVSKTTLYRQFGDKNTLFVETINYYGAPVDMRSVAAPARDVAEARQFLATFGSSFVKWVLSPEVLKLNRIMVMETRRIPALGQLFYDMSVDPAIKTVETILSRVAPAGELELRAANFLQLVSGNILQKIMLGIDVSAAETHSQARLDLAVRMALVDITDAE